MPFEHCPAAPLRKNWPCYQDRSLDSVTWTPGVVGPILVDWPFKSCQCSTFSQNHSTTCISPATYPPSYLPRMRRPSLFCQCSLADIYINSLQLTASQRRHAAEPIAEEKEKSLNPSIMNIQLLLRSFWICTDDPWCKDDLFIVRINQGRKKMSEYIRLRGPLSKIHNRPLTAAETSKVIRAEQ